MSGVHALVLAAGAGSRFGGAKLTRPWGDGLLIDGALCSALAAPADLVWVTVGADPEVADAARRLVPPERLRIVPVPDYDQGLSASLKAGLRALPEDAASALVFLGDMPRIPRAVLAPLVQAVLAGAPAAAPFHHGRRGHPVALGRRLFASMETLDGDRGAGAALESLGPDLVRIDSLDDGVLFDVDAPAKAVT